MRPAITMENGLSERKGILKNVLPLNKELGRGSYGRVFTVKYCELVCAAKEIHSILLDVQDDVRDAVIRSFLRECYHCSELRHPNIVQFLGVYFDDKDTPNGRESLPIMVMELMDQSLTSLVDKQQAIRMKVKMSILHDVSLGLSYLHGQDKPIVHRDLSPNNVLLTSHMVAKISDLGIARVLKTNTAGTTRKTQSHKLTPAPGTLDFMAPETFYDNPAYDTSIDVFSFAGIALHLVCEEWPTPTQLTRMDSKTGKLIAFTEVERRQKYFDKMSGTISTALKPLLESCLDNNPLRRPPIATISELLKDMKTQASDSRPDVAPKPNRTGTHNSAHSSSLPPVHSSSNSLSTAIHQRAESLPHPDKILQHIANFNAYVPQNVNKKPTPEHGVTKPSAAVSPQRHVNTPNKSSYSNHTTPKLMYHSGCMIVDNGLVNVQQLVNQFEAEHVQVVKPKPQKVPLISALQSGKHHIKWRHCADLIYPMYAASVVNDKERIYIMGICEERKGLNVVFVYTIVTDLWTKLPPSDHCWGVLQIVDDKLTIFGGLNCYTQKRTNRVSTFDKLTNSWCCYYPDMIDIRFRPGVVTHLDNVIVAGGNNGSKNVNDDIEVLNWRQRVRWVKSSVCLPVPMWGFSPIISNDELYIVGYCGDDKRAHRKAYKIPITLITSSLEQQHRIYNKWVFLPPSPHYCCTPLPNFSPPVCVGGEDIYGTQSSNVSMYDSFNNSWRHVDSLSSPRSDAAIAIIDDYSIMVIGGYTKSYSTTATSKRFSLSTVEIGQIELA